MNKTFKHSIRQALSLLGIVCASISFSACSDDNGDNGENNNNGNNNNGGGGETATLSISPTTSYIPFSFDATESYPYTVSTNQTSWEVGVTPAYATWCKVEKTADGKGFTVTADPNREETQQRKASITISAKGAKSIAISAVQEGYKPATIHITGVGGDTDNLYYLYWKDGVMQKLGDAISGKIAGGSSTMFVSGNDTYVLGADSEKACYWKNGEKTIIDEATAGDAHSIFIDGKDIYIAGKDVYLDKEHPIEKIHKPYYLKNGIKTMLPTSSTTTVYPSAIAVHNGDIYVVGQEMIAGKGWLACYWKNGKKTNLEEDFSSTSAIAFSGDDVYILGNYDGRNCYWKNEERTFIGDTKASHASSITIHNGDVYIGGYEGDYGLHQEDMACYWKNGERINLPSDRSARVSAISVYGDIVYCAGSESPKICYWKGSDQIYVEPDDPSISLLSIYSIIAK